MMDRDGDDIPRISVAERCVLPDVPRTKRKEPFRSVYVMTDRSTLFDRGLVSHDVM